MEYKFRIDIDVINRQNILAMIVKTIMKKLVPD
jgi:hypothetical protein